ncbi:MAG: S46 family peptidase [Gammaproteobacteria bacterium]
MKKILLTILALPLLINSYGGMWEPYQIPSLKKELREAGFYKNVNSISSPFEYPMNAIVSLGYCSAAFISPEGLIATNYHCVERDFIQPNSSADNDLFEQGFIARSKSEEIQAAPGQKIYVTLESKDITSEILKGTTDDTDSLERFKIIENNSKSIIKNCETSDEIECRVRSFFSGETYKLEKVLQLKDARLVYAPPAHVGEYGGEIDNWMYPRHTGDFALVRAYVGKDGTSKEYAEDNVPYSSDSFLKVSAKGVEEGDFVMVLGYPGRTNRLLTYNQREYDLSLGFQNYVDYLESRINLINTHTNEEDGSSLAYRGSKSGAENYYKKISGQIQGAKNFNVLEREKENWTEFQKFVEANASSQDKVYLDELLAIVDKDIANSEPNRYFGGSTLIDFAYYLMRNAEESLKQDDLRKSGFQERDQSNIKNRIKYLNNSFNLRVDKQLFLANLEKYRTFSSDLRRPVYSELLSLDENSEATLSKVDIIYSTSYSTPESMLKLYGMSFDEITQLDDPLINFMVSLYEESKSKEELGEKSAARKQLLRSKFIKLLRSYYQSIGKQIYSDANSTLRVTFGNVMGSSLRDAVYYHPFTKLEGILEKNTGVEPFNLSKSLEKLIKSKDYGAYASKKLGTVPVNFLSDLDITNGNSGSATINKDFELVGLAFDGMLETIISDYSFIPEARTISVDSRYLLWTLDKVENANNLLEEITIVN